MFNARAKEAVYKGQGMRSRLSRYYSPFSSLLLDTSVGRAIVLGSRWSNPILPTLCDICSRSSGSQVGKDTRTGAEVRSQEDSPEEESGWWDELCLPNRAFLRDRVHKPTELVHSVGLSASNTARC